MTMATLLHVFIDSTKVGTLTRQESDDFVFVYDGDWLHSAATIPLSLSLPLQPGPFAPETSKILFANLLPEGQLRDHFASKHRLSADDDYGLLAVLAGDCAGALAIYPGQPGFKLPAAPRQYRQLEEKELAQLLEEAYIMDPSFLGETERTRLSLAGVQDKLPIAIFGESICLPLDGSPSTHILKPPHHRFPTLVENEGFCMALALEMGLPVPTSYLLRISQKELVYIVERYDRKIGKDGIPLRIHQEDFCQATGHSYRRKYEVQGGPGYAECFQVVSRCRNPLADRIKLINLAIFNYLIGNADCHAKNISLLYDSGSNPSLAPFYDLVCTAIYPQLSSQLAMAIGGIHTPRDVDAQTWAAFAAQAGAGSARPVLAALRKMAAAIPGKAAAVARRMSEQYGVNPVYYQILEVISRRAETMIRQVG